jgi:DNA-binding CsgD family transcriptional regulator
VSRRAILELTEPEIMALWAVSIGCTIPQAADLLDKGVNTVNTQLDRARLKLGARNTTHAVAIATRDGFLP